MNNQSQNLMTPNGHFSTEGRVLYAEAMHLDKVAELPEGLFEHLINCLQCSTETIEAYQLLNGNDIEQPHPYFDGAATASEFYISDDMDELDAVLQDIIRAALKGQVTPNSSLEKKLLQKVKSAVKATFIAPEKDAVCIEKITFKLISPYPRPIRLMLQNEAGKTVKRDVIPPNTLQRTLDCTDLANGLYYWTALAGSTTITNRLYLCSKESANGILGNQ